MNVDTAYKILKCAMEADGGCHYCAAQVMEEAVRQWPEFDWGAFAQDKRLNEYEARVMEDAVAHRR